MRSPLVLYNRVFMPPTLPQCCRCSTCLTTVFAFLLTTIAGLLVLYLVFIGSWNGRSNVSGLTPKYSLEQMRKFAYKNAASNMVNFKPSLYVRWNLSFNRIVEDPTENR